jgi:hypothetical protein
MPVGALLRPLVQMLLLDKAFRSVFLYPILDGACAMLKRTNVLELGHDGFDLSDVAGVRRRPVTFYIASLIVHLCRSNNRAGMGVPWAKWRAMERVIYGGLRR